MSEAREQGRAAYRTGAGGMDNPHAAGTPEHRDWNHGWTDEHYDDTMLAAPDEEGDTR